MTHHPPYGIRLSWLRCLHCIVITAPTWEIDGTVVLCWMRWISVVLPLWRGPLIQTMRTIRVSTFFLFHGFYCVAKESSHSQEFSLCSFWKYSRMALSTCMSSILKVLDPIDPYIKIVHWIKQWWLSNPQSVIAVTLSPWLVVLYAGKVTWMLNRLFDHNAQWLCVCVLLKNV